MITDKPTALEVDLKDVEHLTIVKANGLKLFPLFKKEDYFAIEAADSRAKRRTLTESWIERWKKEGVAEEIRDKAKSYIVKNWTQIPEKTAEELAADQKRP